jgi:hypothetical protein
VDLGVELARATFVIGIVITALFYDRFRVHVGGAITATYLAYTLSLGHFVDVLAWLILAFVGFLAIKLLVSWRPLPRGVVFYVAIFVPAATHGMLVWLGTVPQFEHYSAYLAAGMFITSGLTAYDFARQGIGRTLLALGVIGGLTYSINILMQVAFDIDAAALQVPLFIQVDAILVLICIALAAVLRLSFGMGTSGIIGAIFFLQILNVESILVILTFTILGTFVVRIVTRYISLTPRQLTHATLAVGGILSWFGLFWVEWLGIAGASTPNAFPLEPLVVVGLMIMEGVKHGLPRALGGAGIMVAALLGFSWMLQSGVPHLLVAAAAAPIVLTGLRPMAKRIKSEWIMAEEGGAKYSNSKQ